jgi:hypothetical protein
VTRAFLAMAFLAIALLPPASAKPVKIEFLQGAIDAANVQKLSGIACRNYDRIVHLKISVKWAHDKIAEEHADYKRLIFWDDRAEYLFSKGSYSFLHGDYVLNGYFIPRNGGNTRA